MIAPEVTPTEDTVPVVLPVGAPNFGGTAPVMDYNNGKPVPWAAGTVGISPCPHRCRILCDDMKRFICSDCRGEFDIKGDGNDNS